ncbi:MAG TPA: pilus assembly protein TadG-related protein, partial [Caulobacteraceae bacterium]|nr:pilus assembly protein TadG-related protein [Caulobacteraceae bacterium]
MTVVLGACRSMLARYWRDRTGVAGYFAAISVVALVGLAGYSIDIGHVMLVQRQLQTATDAAALAGATQIVAADESTTLSPTSNAATTSAINYSGLSGHENAANISNTSVTLVSGYP